MEGEQASCSHRETDWRDTSNLSASASWDSPAPLGGPSSVRLSKGHKGFFDKLRFQPSSQGKMHPL